MAAPEGFDDLFRVEYPGVVRELALVLGDVGLAEDVAADAFAELWRKWDHVKDLDRPGAWVRMVALRGAGRARWRRGRRRLVEHSFQPRTAVEQIDLDLVRALAGLTEHQRVAVVLHHLGGWSAREVGEVLGCAEATVRTHLRRGRERLASVLREPDEREEVNDAERR